MATIAGVRRVGSFGCRVGSFWRRALGVGVLVWSLGPFPSTVFATHLVDHRFTVEGFVCGNDGRPIPETEVTAKDTRVSVGNMGYTDSYGHYKVTLHLHNDNLGDPILVMFKDQEQRVTVSFDPQDARTERKVAVNFGSGCVTSASSQWIYYGVGLGAAAVAAVVGATLIRKRRQPVKRGKGKR